MKRREKLVLILGLLGISAAALTAAASPATDYELSIYRSTPLLFWVGVAVSMTGGIFGAIRFANARARLSASLMAVCGLLLITALPFLRHYYFYGQADALQHLGWVVDILAGREIIGTMLYPALHVLAAELVYVTGMGPNRALILLPPVFYACFISSLPLLVREFVGTIDIKRDDLPTPPTAFALLFGLFTTPIIAIKMPNFQPIPTVEALLFVPLTIWAGMWATHSPRGRDRRWRFFIFVVLLLALVFYHPQQAAAASAFLGVYYVAGRIMGRADSTTMDRRDTRAVFGGLIVSGVVLGYWLSLQEGFARAVAIAIVSLQSGGVSSISGGGVAFQQFGGSAIVLFARAFLVPVAVALITVLAGIIALGRVLWRLRDDGSTTDVRHLPTERMVLYLFGMLPILFIAAVSYVGFGLPQALRYLGLLLALGTPIVAVHLHGVWSHVDAQRGTVAVMALILVSAAYTVPTMFAAPFIYKATPHVTEAQLTGYEWLFAHQDETTPIAAVDTDVIRQLIATAGFLPARERKFGSERALMAGVNSSRGPGLVPAHFGGRNPSAVYPPPWYLVTTEYARAQHTRLYAGIRFDRGDFAFLNRTPSASKMFSNGDIIIYRVT